MRILCTTSFDPDDNKILNEFILKNRHLYCDFIKTDKYWTETKIPFERKEWRHCKLIVDVLKNPKFKKYDIIVNTGQSNIITNLNITLEDKVNCYMGPEHAMILQGWIQNPEVYKYHWVFNKDGKIELVKDEFPYLNITSE